MKSSAQKALLLYFIILAYTSSAQSYKLSGIVASSDRTPLQAANVVAEESGVGVFCDENGKYELALPAGKHTIVVSFVGYKPVNRPIEVDADMVINFELEPLLSKLDEVIVAANRSPALAITRLPDVINTYITAGKKNEVIQLDRANVNLAEKSGRQLFAKIPGVFVYDMDGSGNQINISTRGLDPHRSWEYNVRQNGLMTNSDIYGYPASHYSPPMESIQRIELIRGTASLQYGATFGGMINYVVKQPDTTRKINIESIQSAGSFGLFSSFNSVGGKIGQWQYYAYYHKRTSKGYRDNGSSDAEAQYAGITWRPGNKLSIRAELGRSTYLYRLPGPLTDAMFYANPRQATRNRNYYSPDIYIPGLTLDWQLGPRTHLQWSSSGVFGKRNSVQFIGFANVSDVIDTTTHEFKPRQVDIDGFNSHTTELRFTHQYSLGKMKNTLAAGVRYINNSLHRRQLGKGTTGSDYTLALTNPNWGRDMYFKTRNGALFVENLFQITPKLAVTPGFRVEKGITRIEGNIGAFDPDRVPDAIEHAFPLFGVNLQYRANQQTRLYAGWSQAYRPVIFADILPPTPLDATDPNLKNAYGYNAEAGISGELGHSALHFDLSLFRLQVDNRIGSILQDNGQGGQFIYKTNTGTSVTNGAEIYLDFKPQRLFNANPAAFNLSFFTATSFFDAHYAKGSMVVAGEVRNIAGNRLESAPRWISRSGLQCWSDYFHATLQYSYVDWSYADALNTATPSANGGVGSVPSYGLWDFNLAVYLNSHFTLSASLNNIFDRQYFTKRPTIYPGPGIWPSDGRSLVVSMGVRL